MDFPGPFLRGGSTGWVTTLGVAVVGGSVDGRLVGLALGSNVGLTVVGAYVVGSPLGAKVGLLVLGRAVGFTVGLPEGLRVVGKAVGSIDDGAAVGEFVPRSPRLGAGVRGDFGLA